MNPTHQSGKFNKSLKDMVGGRVVVDEHDLVLSAFPRDSLLYYMHAQ